MYFTHLHVHSHYSLLDGMSKIDELLDLTKKMGLEALALTDHGVLYGAIEFYTKAKDKGIKPIIGCELYLSPRTRHDKAPKVDTKFYHLTLLVKNQIGYHNLINLVTIGELEGFYYKPRVDKEVLRKYSEGLIALSGCLRGEIPQALLAKNIFKAKELVLEYQDIFGKDNFYLELQDHPELPEQNQANDLLLQLSQETGAPTVVTCDSHYPLKEDKRVHEVLLAVQTGADADSEDRLTMAQVDLHLKEPQEIIKNFKNHPEIFENIKKIVAACNLELDLNKLVFPKFQTPEGEPSFDYLEKLARENFSQFYDENNKEAKARLEYELGIIKKTNFADYFLVIYDIIRFAREKGILTNARGSVVGSLAAYILGITHIDPIKYDLYFERFLNPERIEPPDIDFDVADDRRQEIIIYISEKYGQDHVAQVLTFGVMKSRLAVRDVNRALGHSYALGDQIAKLIPQNLPLREALKTISEFREIYETNNEAREVIDIAQRLEGVARHASTHAAGVVITPEPIVNFVPLQHSSRSEKEIVTQYEMHSLESIGLVKIDILGLANLTVVKNTLRIIKKVYDQDINLDALGFEDKKVYNLLSQGETIGLFQVESEGMRHYLKDLKPNSLEDIIAMLALYRPGPMELIPKFINRKRGKEKIIYLHPKLESILENTYGVCVAGDAVIQTANPGGIMRMDTLVKDSSLTNIQSLDFERNKFLKKTIIGKYDNGVKDVYKITLRTGKEIKATDKHQFWTPSGWKIVKELKIGDFLATPKKLFVGNKNFNINKIKILAYLIADGALTSGVSCYFVNKDQILLKDFKKSVELAFKNTLVHFSTHKRNVKRAIPAKKDKTGSLYHQPNSVLRWLRELGLKTKHGGFSSEDKFVPRFIFELKDNLITAFLAAYWDCDGGINKKLAYITTISKRLAFDIQTLLLKLGINSYIYFTEKYVGRYKEIKKVYKLCVYDLVAFKKQIGYLMLASKKKILKSLAKNIYRREFVPRKIFLEKTLTYLKDYKISQRAFCRLAKINRSAFFKNNNKQKNRLEIEVARKIATYLQNSVLQKICDKANVIRWEDIINIEYGGKEKVYDIEVQGTHNYIVNNIISHNCVFQEQLMQIAHDLAGFSMAEADVLRKAVGKKMKVLLHAQKEKLIEGMIKNNIKKPTAEKIWEWVEPFARYGFNKGHSSSYARITYQTAWLKVHYPNAFMAALLTSDFGNLDRVAIEIKECERMGIKVISPSVNKSFVEFGTDKETGNIIFGLSAIKNVGTGVAEMIQIERQQNGQFTNLINFFKRIPRQVLNRKTLESLIKSGALDCFGSRELMVDNLDKILEWSYSVNNHNNFQMGLFKEDAGDILSHLGQSFPPDKTKRLVWEKEYLGIYLTGHPLDDYKGILGKIALTVSQLGALHLGKRIKVCGFVSRIQRVRTKIGKPMVFTQISDYEHSIDVVLYPTVLANYMTSLSEDKVILVEGRMDKRNGEYQIIGEKIEEIKPMEA